MKYTHLYLQIYPLVFLMFFISSCGGQSNPKIVKSDTPQSISETLKKNQHLPVEKRIALYHQLKKENPDGYNFENEDELTMYGYSLLWDDKTSEAIEIFKLIVEQFPDSSNPYDSLGEGYMVNGNKKKAIANYEKSLALNPDNFNAEEQIERMLYPNKKPETFADKFAKKYTPKEYKEDLDQLGKRIIKVHPSALKFISKNDFWKIIEAKKALITDQTTYSEFYWHCYEIVASVNCSHSSMFPFFQEEDMNVSLRFPLQIRLINQQLFVTDPLNNKNTISTKDEILSINGVPIADLLRDIYKHIPSQGLIETSKRHDFNTWYSAMIPYALNFPESFEIIVKGKDNPIRLKTAKTFNVQSNDPSIQSCKDNLCFEILDPKTAIMTISSFNYYPWNNLSVFKKFVDARFKEIDKKGIENLIIDVRFNGGGSQESSIHLLRYLVNKSFVYSTSITEVQAPFENAFKGRLYFMIDGNGNSTTGHFMSLVKEFNLGTIVGEELGSNQFCSAGQTICRLTNTKLKYYLANSTNATTATSFPDETGILPDHFVSQSIDDYLNQVDVVKEFTINLINKK